MFPAAAPVWLIFNGSPLANEMSVLTPLGAMPVTSPTALPRLFCKKIKISHLNSGGRLDRGKTCRWNRWGRKRNFVSQRVGGRNRSRVLIKRESVVRVDDRDRV